MLDTIREPVRVLFHLNGYTKLVYERYERGGMLDDPMFELPTRLMPWHFRAIGSRFLLEWQPIPRGLNLSADEVSEYEARHTRFLELAISESGLES